jgi:hypothetical protein
MPRSPGVTRAKEGVLLRIKYDDVVLHMNAPVGLTPGTAGPCAMAPAFCASTSRRRPRRDEQVGYGRWPLTDRTRAAARGPTGGRA